MNTSAINNPAGLLQTIAPTPGKADMGATPDAPSFNQVLTREMSSQENNTSSTTGTGNATPAANALASKDATKAAQQKDASDKGDATASDTAAASQDTPAADGTKAEAGKVTASKGVKKDQDQACDKVDLTSDQASIAAFVSALTNAKAAPTAVETASAATAASTAAPVAAAAVDSKQDIKAKNDRIDIAARITGQQSETTDGDGQAVGKKSDFVSALDKAKTGTGSDTAEIAKSAMTNADLAVATQSATVKGDAASLGAMPSTFAAAVAAAVMQPAVSAPAATSQTAELLPPVGGAGWDDALGQKVIWMAKGAEQTATLTLNPPDLGPMQVTVNVSNNQATATFVAHQPEVRHALEASMPRLREMLHDAGIQLGQSSVSAGTPNQQNGFDDSQSGGSGRRARVDNSLAETALHVTHVPTPLGGSGMVDTFA